MTHPIASTQVLYKKKNKRYLRYSKTKICVLLTRVTFSSRLQILQHKILTKSEAAPDGDRPDGVTLGADRITYRTDSVWHQQ